LRSGERVRIDFPNRRLDILLPETELAERRRTFQPAKQALTGWLARYQRMVTNASQGAVLV
jgi:dihydroxy-acid dehydratase